MNERIKELAEQADLITHKVPNGLAHLHTEQDIYKFAELIVKECTSKILESLEAANINLSSRPNDDYWLGFRHACDDNLTDIRNHLGVK